MLGSFMDGLFSGYGSVMELQQAQQGIRLRQDMMNAYDMSNVNANVPGGTDMTGRPTGIDMSSTITKPSTDTESGGGDRDTSRSAEKAPVDTKKVESLADADVTKVTKPSPAVELTGAAVASTKSHLDAERTGYGPMPIPAPTATGQGPESGLNTRTVDRRQPGPLEKIVTTALGRNQPPFITPTPPSYRAEDPNAPRPHMAATPNLSPNQVAGSPSLLPPVPPSYRAEDPNAPRPHAPPGIAAQPSPNTVAGAQPAPTQPDWRTRTLQRHGIGGVGGQLSPNDVAGAPPTLAQPVPGLPTPNTVAGTPIPGSRVYVDPATGRPYDPNALPAPTAPATTQYPATPAGAPGIATQPAAPPAAAAPTPAPTPQASLGSRILSAINPIGSAQAETLPPPAKADEAGQSPLLGQIPGGVTDPSGNIVPGSATPGTAKATTASTTPRPSDSPPAPVQPGPVQVTNREGRTEVQSETAPTMPKPTYRMDYYEALRQQRPDQLAIVQEVANEFGITPARLALHWGLESDLKSSSPDSTNGARGVMQVTEETQRTVDPHLKLNPAVFKDSLRMGAAVIRNLDAQFGKDSAGSIAGYFGGPGTANQFAVDLEAAKKANPNTRDYLKNAYGGEDKLAQNMFTRGGDVDWQAATKAGIEGGPEPMQRVIASTGPAGLAMTDKWRNFESAAMRYFAFKGDIQGMQHARDFAFQMSHQGAVTNLMQAHQMILAGNMDGAAKTLAAAHTFFPDDTIGRFGVDSKGRLIGETYSEHTGKFMGQFEITADKVMGQIVGLQNHNNYGAALLALQKTNAEIDQLHAHSDYWRSKPDVAAAALKAREDRAALSDKTRMEIEARREDAARALQAQKDAAAAERQRAGLDENSRRRNEIDKDATKRYGAEGTETGSPEQLAAMSSAYRVLRDESRMGDPEAHSLASGLVSGRLIDKRRTDGTYAAVDKSGKVVAEIPLPLAQHLRLAGATPPAQQQPGIPVVGGATSTQAAAAGVTPTLAGTVSTTSSAIPPAHAEGGGISTVTGPNPGNGDSGYITAQPGEFVLSRAATAHYGGAILNALNTGKVDPQKLYKAVIQPPKQQNSPSSQARH